MNNLKLPTNPLSIPVKTQGISKSIKKTFLCPYPECKWSFDTLYKIQRHIRSHTKEKPYQCTKCRKSFSNKYNLTDHQKTHEVIKCTLENCSQVFCKEAHLNQHKIHEHNTKLMKCPKKRCMQYFSSKEELNEHLSKHDFLHKCEQCDKRFRTLSLLKLHVLSVHETESLSYKCSYENCDKKFVNKQRLLRHELIHENKRSFVCMIENCGKSFNCPEYLRLHKRVHEPESKIPCIFPTCKKLFASPQSLKVHLQTHTDFRPYRCTIGDCKKTYLTASNLKVHQESHKKSLKHQASEQQLNSIDIVNKEYFENVPLFEVCALNEDILSLQEGVIAASVGEFAISQYVSQFDDVKEQNDNCLPKNNKKQATSSSRISNQVEEDGNVYSMLDTNILMSHDYEQVSITVGPSKTSIRDKMKLPHEQMEDKCRELYMTDELMSTSMELSTGHLEIDGSELSPLSCVPDHIYVNTKSTVNLDDIR